MRTTDQQSSAETEKSGLIEFLFGTGNIDSFLPFTLSPIYSSREQRRVEQYLQKEFN